MTATLFMRMQLEDFDSWLNPNPAEADKMFRDAGAVAYGLHRSPDDGNSVMSWFQFPDAEMAKSFDTGYRGMKADYEAQNPGAAHEIVESWVGADVMHGAPV